jgi:hypothetical protein
MYYYAMKLNRESDSKRWNLNYRRREITQKKAYDIQYKAKSWNQEEYILHLWYEKINKYEDSADSIRFDGPRPYNVRSFTYRIEHVWADAVKKKCVRIHAE